MFQNINGIDHLIFQNHFWNFGQALPEKNWN